MSWASITMMSATLSLAVANVLLQVPFVAQQKESCGAAALAMVMRYHGGAASHDLIAAELHETELRGIRGSRLAEWARDAGFFALAYAGDLDHLRGYLAKGRPLIVALESGQDTLHDVVVVGWDSDAREVIVHDPALGPQRRIGEDELERRWRASGRWTLLILPAASTGTSR